MDHWEESRREFDRKFTLAIGKTLAVICVSIALCMVTGDCISQRSASRCRAVCGDAGVRTLDPCECERGQGQRITVQQVSR
jgi:hypothetical protein